jgi:hypothetical protein
MIVYDIELKVVKKAARNAGVDYLGNGVTE